MKNTLNLKTKILYLFLAITLGSINRINAQNVIDVGYMEAIFSHRWLDGVVSASTDLQGNIIQTTTIYNLFDINPDPSITDTLDIDRNYSYISIAKYSPELDLLWYQIIDSAFNSPYLLTCCDNQGDLYTLSQGYCTDIDPNPAHTETIVNDTNDYKLIWLAKYDGSTGHLLWVNKLYPNGPIQNQKYTFSSMRYDSVTHSIHIVGHLQYGLEIYEYDTLVDSLTAGSIQQMFVLSYDTEGDYKWSGTTQGSSYDTYAYSSTTRTDGSIVVVGKYDRITDFSLQPGVSHTQSFPAAGKDIGYIVCYDSTGQYLWSQNMGGFQNDQVEKVTSDAQNNIYVNGYFSDQVDFNPSGSTPMQLTADWNYQYYIAKYSPQAQLKWVHKIINTGVFGALDMNVSHDGELLMCGAFNDTLQLAGADTIVENSKSFYYDGYIARLSASTGLAESLIRMGTQSNFSFVRTFTKRGRVYKATGKTEKLEYLGSNGQMVTYDLTPQNKSFLYIMTLDDFPLVVHTPSTSSYTLYPNPTYDQLHIQPESGITPQHIRIHDIMGRCVYSSAYSPSVSVESLSPGSYVLSLSDDSSEESVVFIKK